MDYYFIGDTELAAAFRFIGVDGQAVSDAGEAETAFRRVTDGREEGPGSSGHRVLILTEEVADWLEELTVKWQMSGRYPLVVEVPGIMGRLPGRKTLVHAIREAIGIHV